MNITNIETGEVVQIPLQSAEINELAKAMAKAQGAMTAAKMDGSNPHFRSSYATLDSIWQAARRPLTENGLSVIQQLLPDNVLVTTLLHESGQWMKSYLKLNPIKNDPQGVGSALTYGRRYSLAAIVGIAQADDDGEDATSQPAGNKRPLEKKSEKPEVPPSPGAQWLPTSEEFFGYVEAELKISTDEAKRILKEAKYDKYERSKATEMFKVIQRELRIQKESGKIRDVVNGDQPELLKQETAPRYN